jgi:CHAT domain-containing protein/tetratricopeptide (TPR) repeat protein
MLLTACQSTMSVEEARKVSAQFGGRSFVPPPRTINDIMSLLDRERLADPEAAGRARGRAEQPPPASTSAVTLAAFYYERGLAAREVGRTSQEIGDLTRALDWAERGGASPRAEWDAIATELAWAEGYSGNFPRAEAILRRLIATTPAHRRGALIKVYNMAAFLHGLAGDLEATEVATARLVALVDESRTWQNQRPGYRAQAADAEGRLAQLKGQYAQGEAFFREAIQWLARDPATSKSTYVDRLYSRIALVLVRQGRLLEAEKEARVALLGALTKQGRYSAHTARMLRELTYVIFEQGRNAEAEALARAAVEIYRQTGSPADSTALALARSQLGAALAAQGRWQEALAEYEAIKAGLAGDPQGYERYLRRNLDWALAILGTGRPAQALEMLQAAFESNRRLLGAAHPDAAEARGLMGMAHVALGDRARALREFQAATPILLARGAELEDESTSQPARERRRTLILGSHVGLLADIRGTPLERQAGVDVVAEAFRLADVARGRSVQRALDAGGARAAAGTPALAELIRREQDATKQISALHGVVVNALGSQQDPKTVGTLRTQIDTLRRARDSLAAHIAREFPAYAQLIDPAPATLDRARSALRPGEALIATFVSADRTFVWAIPRTGAVAFAAAPIGEEALQDAVTRLRAALDPGAKTVGEIPPFDLLLAHRLYQALLAPVAAGWRQADSLLIVGHGALGQLPLALLPTKPATLGPEREPIFANYRAVPWLVRTHAVTVLPSVTALATLRALPSANPRRRPFVGFGDPYFSHEQVQRAARRGEPREALAPPAGAAPIMLRSSPGTQGRDTAQLGMLPRLPETAEEIRSIARALDADPTGDVFIGARANELAVKTLDLSGYRVIAFATHGLVPGDLDGLAEPALALSAPGVAEVDGDGLLTMDEILGLRLNADWVVLSACNTASGKGAGAEAVSGLGRAFFYAGARALLVSNWPVETTSARALTTGLFRRQGAAPGLSRTGALQQTLNWMIDEGVFVDPRTSKVAFSYAHPIFWAPFTLVGDGGGGAAMGP